jgi:hypothetical protein
MNVSTDCTCISDRRSKKLVNNSDGETTFEATERDGKNNIKMVVKEVGVGWELGSVDVPKLRVVMRVMN